MKKSSKKSFVNPVDAYFLTLSSSSASESYVYRVRQFCQFNFNNSDYSACDFATLRYTDVLTFLQHEKNGGRAFNSVNVTLAAIKGVALHCWQLGLITFEEYNKIKRVKRLSGSRCAAGRALDLRELRKIKQFYYDSAKLIDIRDYAIFSLAVGAGLRRSEICNLDVEHINKNKLTVTGKFNKMRVVFLNDFVKSALARWLSISNIKSGAIFVTSFSSREPTRLTKLSIHRAIERVVKNSDCTAFTCHDLRRTFATFLLDNNADKFSVMRLMGHSNLTTTELYDRRHEIIDNAAVNLLQF